MTPKQTVEAKCKCDVSDDCFMTPIYKNGLCEYCYKYHQAPSPNEAPKGEAAFFYPTKKEVKGLVRFANDLHEKAQPPPPDKEWEEKLKNGKIVEINGKKYFKPFRGYTVTLNYFIHSLLKAKDQEADRRVEEVIGIVDNYFATKRFASIDIRTNEAVQFQLRVIYNELKKKLSLSHKEEEK